MRVCKNCEEVILDLTVLRHDTSDRPVAQHMIPKYCPFCACLYMDDNIKLKPEERKLG